MPVKKRLDVLDDFCGSESDEGSDAEDGPGPAKKRATAPKVTVQALERAGYQSGPSVLHVPEQKVAEPEGTWDWSKGERHEREASPTPEERRHMKEASTTGVVADAVHARKLMEQTQRLRAEKQAEKDAKAKRGQLSHKDKEKRKRNAGMQASSKNYVEEEKRRAREAGLYHGFDS